MPVFLLLVQNSFAVFHQIRVLSWGARDFSFASCFASVMNKTLTACHVSWRHPSACDRIDVAGTFVWPTSYTNINIPTSFFLNTIVSPNNYLPTQTYSCVQQCLENKQACVLRPRNLPALRDRTPLMRLPAPISHPSPSKRLRAIAATGHARAGGQTRRHETASAPSTQAQIFNSHHTRRKHKAVTTNESADKKQFHSPTLRNTCNCTVITTVGLETPAEEEFTFPTKIPSTRPLLRQTAHTNRQTEVLAFPLPRRTR